MDVLLRATMRDMGTKWGVSWVMRCSGGIFHLKSNGGILLILKMAEFAEGSPSFIIQITKSDGILHQICRQSHSSPPLHIVNTDLCHSDIRICIIRKGISLGRTEMVRGWNAYLLFPSMLPNVKAKQRVDSNLHPMASERYHKTSIFSIRSNRQGRTHASLQGAGLPFAIPCIMQS